MINLLVIGIWCHVQIFWLCPRVSLCCVLVGLTFGGNGQCSGVAVLIEASHRTCCFLGRVLAVCTRFLEYGFEIWAVNWLGRVGFMHPSSWQDFLSFQNELSKELLVWDSYTPDFWSMLARPTCSCPHKCSLTLIGSYANLTSVPRLTLEIICSEQRAQVLSLAGLSTGCKSAS